MTKKQKKMLVRIIITAVMLVGLKDFRNGSF